MDIILRRLGRARSRLGVPGVLALAWIALVVWEVATSPRCLPANPCRGPLDAVWWLSGLQITAMVSWLLLLVAGPAGLWFNAAVALMVAVPDDHPVLWWLMAASLAATALLGHRPGSARPLLPITRPERLGPHLDADRTAELSSWAADHYRAGLRLRVLALALVALAAGLLAWMLPAIAIQHRFEEGSRVVRVPVVALSDVTPVVDVAGEHIQVSVAGGAAEEYHVGQQVEVRVNDAVPGRAELVAEPNDPSWRVGLAGLALAAATWCWWTLVRPRAHLRAVVEAPAWQFQGQVIDHDEIVLLRDGHQVALLRGSATGSCDGGGDDQVPSWLDTLEDGPDWPEDPAGLTVEQLARWADEVVLFTTTDLDDESDWAPGQAVEVEVLGLPVPGGVVVARVAGGRPFRARVEPPAAPAGPPPPQTRSGARRTAMPRTVASLDQAIDRAAGAAQPDEGMRARLLRQWSPTLRWVLGLGTGLAVPLVSRWLLDEPTMGTGDLVRMALFGLSLITGACTVGAGHVHRHRRGAVRYGLVADQVWQARRVSGIFPGRLGIAVRLRSPQDVIAVDPRDMGVTLAQAPATLSDWFARAEGTGPGTDWRPAPLVLSLVLAVATWFASSPQGPLASLMD